MKRLFLAVAIILMVSILMTTGCTQSASPTSAVTSSSQSPVTSSVKPIELIWADHAPPGGDLENYYQEWAKMLEQESGGRVKFTFYFSESLVKGPEMYGAVKRGVADISVWVTTMDPVRMEPLAIADVPGMDFPDVKVASQVLQDLINKYPEMHKPLEGVMDITEFTAVPRIINMTKKEIRTPDDIKGVKVYATGAGAEAMQLVDAAPVPLQPSDWATSLDRGLIEGMISGWWPPGLFHVDEYLHTHTEGLDLGKATNFTIMNPDSFNKLPADIQKMLKEKYFPLLQQTVIELDIKNATMFRDKAVARGDTIINLTPEQKQLWYDAFKPLHDKWIKDTSSVMPSQQIYDEAKQLIKKYSNQ
jgi:TRAP-type C4-dicarboxylate transport system substrate-binding protein